jgi:membrane protein
MMHRPFISTSTLLVATLAAAVGTMLLSSAGQGGENSTETVSDNNGDNRGRQANTPESIPAKGLKDVFWRIYEKLFAHRVTLIAAGVAFYLLLSVFPALGALVSLYGIVADPATISDHLRDLSSFLPPGAFEMIEEQVKSIVERRNSTLGIAFFLGLGIALWSTHNATLAIFDAMNVAYEEKEKRGLIKLNLVGLCFTICAILVATAMVFLVGVMPVILKFLWLDTFKEQTALFVRWPLMLVVVIVAAAAVYRFGPSREPAKVRWMTWGAGFTAIGWFSMSFGFAFYLNHFADYSATYGTLGALIGFLMWTWLSVVILILGAALNAELEHQTERDTTTGTPVPMGVRGAYVADTVGQAAD